MSHQISCNSELLFFFSEFLLNVFLFLLKMSAENNQVNEIIFIDSDDDDDAGMGEFY